MLGRLKKQLTFTRPEYPSAMIVVGSFDSDSTIRILHLVPEDGTIERVYYTSHSATFCYAGATERSREQVGTVILDPRVKADGVLTIVNELKGRVRKLWDDRMSSSSASRSSPPGTSAEDVTTDLVRKVLEPAALDAIREREGRNGRASKENGTEPYIYEPIYIIYINRSKPGPFIPKDPTSIGP